MIETKTTKSFWMLCRRMRFKICAYGKTFSFSSPSPFFRLRGEKIKFKKIYVLFNLKVERRKPVFLILFFPHVIDIGSHWYVDANAAYHISSQSVLELIWTSSRIRKNILRVQRVDWNRLDKFRDPKIHFESHHCMPHQYVERIRAHLIWISSVTKNIF